MENGQSVQEQPSQAKAPTSKPENSKSQQTGSSNVLTYLLGHHSWLFLIGLLAVFLGGAALSVYSLGYVGIVEQTKPEEEEALQAEVVPPTNTPSETANPIPLWMVGAIALSCASGCLIIFRFLKRPAPPQKVQKQINRQSRLHRRRHQKLPSVPPQPQASVIATSVEKKPVVTVLPPEQSLTGGKNQENLASMLDIRKQTSLSAILRKN
ncbi:MAG: hypothetical protein DSM106950_25335 [Stigonema ocellatum SAG 48.90 = DSM 106950]|nr:hypothetical protein [Stigonema ocellatum SAG 48.90 = DSM 106950]